MEQKEDKFGELTIKFTKILAEFISHLERGGFRKRIAIDLMKYIAKNVRVIVESLNEDEIRNVDIEKLLYVASTKISKDEGMLYTSHKNGFIPEKNQLMLKYRTLSYLRDAMKELESKDWESPITEGMIDSMVDGILERNGKKKSKSTEESHDKLKHGDMTIKSKDDLPDFDDAIANGGMYLPKVLMINNELGFGIVQFNYDLENLMNNDEED